MYIMLTDMQRNQEEGPAMNRAKCLLPRKETQAMELQQAAPLYAAARTAASPNRGPRADNEEAR